MDYKKKFKNAEELLEWTKSISGHEDWASEGEGKRYAKYGDWFIEDTGFTKAITPIRYHIHNEKGYVTTTTGTVEEAMVNIEKSGGITKQQLTDLYNQVTNRNLAEEESLDL